jgi:pre-mRNA-splicing factor ATP-dependent RNA helicase DHX15/PRP43
MQESDWLIYNEFVLTSKNYIRTVTQIKPEWLLEIAPVYYDLSTFKEGDVLQALKRVAGKLKRKEQLAGKAIKTGNGY